MLHPTQTIRACALGKERERQKEGKVNSFMNSKNKIRLERYKMNEKCAKMAEECTALRP